MLLVRRANPDGRYRCGTSSEHTGRIDTFDEWNDARSDDPGGGFPDRLSGAFDAGCGWNGNELPSRGKTCRDRSRRDDPRRR